mgnify:FL=1
MIIDVVKNILVNQMDVDESKITMETRLNEDLKFDSIDKAELITSLEDEFDIMVDYEQVLHVNTIQEIVDEIKKYIKED